MRCPSWMPAGTSTLELRAPRACAPRRRSRGTGARSITPRPRQSGHGLRAHELAEHAARDLLQPAGAAAARAGRDSRAGLHAVAAARRARRRRPRTGPRRSCRARPRRARSRSRPRGRRRAARAAPRLPKRSSPKNAEKRSPRLPKSKCVGGKPPRAQAGVAVAVVELRGVSEFESTSYASATSRKRTSASGCVGDVGVQLARERAERLLDLALVGVARDAEQLVVVAFGRGHQSYGSGVVVRLVDSRRSATARAPRSGRSAAPSRSPCAAGRAG